MTIRFVFFLCYADDMLTVAQGHSWMTGSFLLLDSNKTEYTSYIFIHKYLSNTFLLI